MIPLELASALKFIICFAIKIIYLSGYLTMDFDHIDIETMLTVFWEDKSHNYNRQYLEG